MIHLRCPFPRIGELVVCFASQGGGGVGPIRGPGVKGLGFRVLVPQALPIGS